MADSGARFPLFVDVAGKRAVIVGGGRVAGRRAAVLRRFGMEVTVISPALREQMEGIVHLARPYAPGDLAGAALAVAALSAEGESRLFGLEHIRRGYGDLAGTLRSLGAEAVCQRQ